MARPAVHRQDRISTQVRFSKATHQKLAKAALERDLSVNSLVEKAVKELLERLIPVDEIKWTRD